MQNIPEEYGQDITDPVIKAAQDKFVFFADYAGWCWAWAIACDEGENRGKIAVVGGAERFVANSFAEFVDLHIAREVDLGTWLKESD